MFNITYDLIFDIDNSSIQKIITVPKDTNRTYYFDMSVVTNEQAISLENYLVNIEAYRQDETVTVDNCIVSGNTASYTLDASLLAVSGDLNCLLKIYAGETLLYTFSFCCIVTDAPWVSEDYVTPEMHKDALKIVPDNMTDMNWAFSQGKNVVFLQDYYVENNIQVINQSNITVHGNNYTITVASKEKTNSGDPNRYTFQINDCQNLSFEDLTIRSTADKNLILGVEQFKTSHVEGFKIQNSNYVSIKNYTSYNLFYDITLQKCSFVWINGWYSNSSIMGFYSSSTSNAFISNFKVEMDPYNAMQYYHAFYLCYGLDNIHISDGECIFKNQYEKVTYTTNGENITITQRTPLLTIHTDNKIREKSIYVDNVRFTGQRIINVREMLDTPIFSNCTFTAYYPSNALHNTDVGHLTIFSNTIFDHCTFNLGDLNAGFQTGYETTDFPDYTVFLRNCKIRCTNRQNEGNTLPFLLGYVASFKLDHCYIDWPYHIRKISQKISRLADTKFFHCLFKLPSGKSVLVLANGAETNTAFVDSVIKDGYFIATTSSSRESRLTIINSRLESAGNTWYDDKGHAFLGATHICHSYHNDARIDNRTIEGVAVFEWDENAFCVDGSN